MPHRKGSFNEDWNELLTRFADRRKQDRPRAGSIELARDEALRPCASPNFRLNQGLFERAGGN